MFDLTYMNGSSTLTLVSSNLSRLTTGVGTLSSPPPSTGNGREEKKEAVVPFSIRSRRWWYVDDLVPPTSTLLVAIPAVLVSLSPSLRRRRN